MTFRRMLLGLGIACLTAAAFFVGMRFSRHWSESNWPESSSVPTAVEFSLGQTPPADAQPGKFHTWAADSPALIIPDESAETVFLPAQLGEENRTALLVTDTDEAKIASAEPNNSGPKLVPLPLQKTQPTDADAHDSRGPSDIPEELPSSSDASPITQNKRELDALARAIIRLELPNATDEERDIWFDELKGMSPNMIRDLLRLRRSVGGEHLAKPRDFLKENTTGEPVESRLVKQPAVIETDPVGSAMEFQDESDVYVFQTLTASILAVKQARNVITHNLANANTTAFKRSSVSFEEIPFQLFWIPPETDMGLLGESHNETVGPGMRFLGTSVDHRAGKPFKTGRSLDLAIAGPGYFCVASDDGLFYRRAGTFDISPDGEVVLKALEKIYRLEPRIEIPANVSDITISNDGTVSGKVIGSSARTTFGVIQLAGFSNPSRLVSLGGGLFAEGEAAGEPKRFRPGKNGLGPVLQGFLESSNVDLQSELAEWKRLNAQLRALEQARSLLLSEGRIRERPVSPSRSGVVPRSAGGPSIPLLK